MIEKEKVFLLMMVITITVGCSNTRTNDDRFMEQMATNNKTQVYQLVRTKAEQSLKDWLNLGLRETQVLRDCNWKVDDGIFFNSKLNRCYLLLLLQDKDTNAELDYVYMMYGALINKKWTIYYLSFPNLVFPRTQITKSNHIPIPLTTLSRLSRAELLKEYYNSDGSINDSFIDRALTPDVIRRHEEFLENIRKK
jgi:archaellin